MNKQITIFSGCLIRNGKVLLVQRDEEECPDAHLKWEFPGGKVDFGETPQESLKREFLEETGITIEVVRILPYVQTAYWDYKWGKQQTLCFNFVCKYISQKKLAVKDHHVKHIKWVKIADAPKLSSLPGTMDILKLATQKVL